jgi:hypothetical protein
LPTPTQLATPAATQLAPTATQAQQTLW